MDLDTFEMSPEKRAFTVECVDMNANAPGRLYHYHRCEIVLLFLSPSLFFFSISISSLGSTLLTHAQSVCVLVARYWLWRAALSSLFTSPLWSFIASHKPTHTHLREVFNNRLLQKSRLTFHLHTHKNGNLTFLLIRAISRPHSYFLPACILLNHFI